MSTDVHGNMLMRMYILFACPKCQKRVQIGAKVGQKLVTKWVKKNQVIFFNTLCGSYASANIGAWPIQLL